MIVQAIRSTLFYFVFFLHTIPVALVMGLMAKLTPGLRAQGWALGQYWVHANLFFLRWIVGIRTEVTGGENIPEGGCIIASKHQSDWDIYALVPQTPQPAFIAKKELLDIPLFGWAARWIDTIPVDRKKGKDALPDMMRTAAESLERGCQVIIFPEGTRRPPLAEPAYRSGVTKMYAALDVPVVPVALTSGLYWSRNSPVLWPGTARAHILPPIAPGLSPAAFQKQLVETIEAESDRMALEDVHKGLSRPITPRLRTCIAEREARSGDGHDKGYP